MKYDDASWHYDGDFPEELPSEAGATHIGIFLAWALLKGFASELHLKESTRSLELLRQRAITGADFLRDECDEKFTDDDLNAEGNRFAQWYYQGEEGYGPYVDDYEAVLADDAESLYHVADTWENFDKMAGIIDFRFKEWKETTGGADSDENNERGR
jgi:hypothetical protein